MPLNKIYQEQLFAPPKKWPDSQPVNFVDGSEPPMLLLYGDKDTTVKPRNIANLTKKVEDLGGDVTSIIYPGINHAGLVGAMSRLVRNNKPVAADIVAFLNEHAK
jgi:acetyl esterase/lipase